jgi:hypothetical protein
MLLSGSDRQRVYVGSVATSHAPVVKYFKADLYLISPRRWSRQRIDAPTLAVALSASWTAARWEVIVAPVAAGVESRAGAR